MTATLDIDVLDAAGHATGQTVTVTVDWILCPYRYGEDADGNRGETRYERDVLDVYIDPEHLTALTSTQAEQVIDEATEQFNSRR